MTGTEPGAAAVGSLQHARHLLRAMLGDIDTAGPLPTPTRWATDAEDTFPGAVWETGWRSAHRYSDVSGRLEIIAAMEDVGDDNPAVYIRGLEYGGDVSAMTPDQARAVGRALLAAADMAGSPLIAKRCSAAHRIGR